MENHQQLKQNCQSSNAYRDYHTNDSEPVLLCKPLLFVDFDRYNTDHMLHTTP